MIAMPFGPLLAWKRGDLLGAAQRLMAAGIAALVAIALVWGVDLWRRDAGAACDRACGLRDRGRAVRSRRAHCAVPRAALDLAAPCPRVAARDMGAAFAHAGVGVALIGIVCETAWKQRIYRCDEAG